MRSYFGKREGDREGDWEGDWEGEVTQEATLPSIFANRLQQSDHFQFKWGLDGRSLH